MLDLHVNYSSAGSGTLAQPATIPANDGQVLAGVPMITTPKAATLLAWGGVAINGAADAIKEAQLTSNDLNDPANGSTWLPSGTSLVVTTPHFTELLIYQTASRVIKLAQKAAAACFTYTLDHYADSIVRASTIKGDRTPMQRGIYSQLFGQAVTAGAWSTQIFTPATNLPQGRYAILGFWVNALTNVAAVRFQHADFGSVQPGCIGADLFTTGLNDTNLSGDEIMMKSQGVQFVRFGELLKAGACPVFRAGPNGTGLTIWCFDLTADTPTVILNLAYLGG